MIIHLQDITDHKLWCNWRIVDNHIEWWNGQIRIHANQLEDYPNIVRMLTDALGELRRIYNTPQHITDIDHQRLLNVRRSIHQIEAEIQNLTQALEIVESNLSRTVDRSLSLPT